MSLAGRPWNQAPGQSFGKRSIWQVKKTLLGTWESEAEGGRASGCHRGTGAYFWGREHLTVTAARGQGSWVFWQLLVGGTLSGYMNP